MNKKFLKRVSLLLMVCMIFMIMVSPISAAENDVGGFKASEDSTWGDLMRHFNPEEFANLPSDAQDYLDSQQLNSGTNKIENADTMIEKNEETLIGRTFGTVSRTIGGFAKDLPIDELQVLVVVLDPSKTTIDYSAQLTSMIECPYLYVSIALYEADSNTWVDFDSSVEFDSDSCGVDGTFTDLERRKDYRVESIAYVTPPAGYYVKNPIPPVILNPTTK